VGLNRYEALRCNGSSGGNGIEYLNKCASPCSGRWGEIFKLQNNAANFMLDMRKDVSGLQNQKM
jgi:hypothetical protein